MGSRVMIALAAAAVAVLPWGDRATAGCSPNLAWQDRFPQWSPRGDRILFLRETVDCAGAPNDLVIARPGGTPLRTFHRAWAPAWSPDGRYLAFVQSGLLRIEQIAGGRSTRVVGPADASWVAWGAPGIAFFRGGSLWLTGLTGEAHRLSDGLPLRGPLAWTPTNELVAIRTDRPGDDETMLLVRVGLDGALTALTPASGRYGRMTVSGGTGRIVVSHRPRGGADWQLDELDPATGGRRVVFDSAADDVEPVFAPDGLRLAFIEQHRIDEGFLATLSPLVGESAVGYDAHPFSPPAWSPDGGTLLYAAGHECLRWGVYRVPGSVRLTNRCRFTGTSRRDTLRGSPFLDFLVGRESGDRLLGGGGRDWIDGGAGADVLEGGGDWDRLLGRAGADTLRGGGGPDWLLAGTGHDRVDGGAGNDQIVVRDGRRDWVRCGAGRGDLVVADRLDVVARDCERIVRV
jgi:Tol biopolymer transport system component